MNHLYPLVPSPQPGGALASRAARTLPLGTEQGNCLTYSRQPWPSATGVADLVTGWRKCPRLPSSICVSTSRYRKWLWLGTWVLLMLCPRRVLSEVTGFLFRKHSRSISAGHCAPTDLCVPVAVRRKATLQGKAVRASVSEPLLYTVPPDRTLSHGEQGRTVSCATVPQCPRRP